jgi:hypothetical protein
LQQKRLPAYLKPGENFLGKYAIQEVVPYWRILLNEAMRDGPVFSGVETLTLAGEASAVSTPPPAKHHEFSQFDFFALDSLYEETVGILKKPLFKQLTADVPGLSTDPQSNERKKLLWQK